MSYIGWGYSNSQLFLRKIYFTALENWDSNCHLLVESSTIVSYFWINGFNLVSNSRHWEKWKSDVGWKRNFTFGSVWLVPPTTASNLGKRTYHFLSRVSPLDSRLFSIKDAWFGSHSTRKSLTHNIHNLCPFDLPATFIIWKTVENYRKNCEMPIVKNVWESSLIAYCTIVVSRNRYSLWSQLT